VAQPTSIAAEAVDAVAPGAEQPNALDLGGFKMADPDFLMNDDWRGTDSGGDSYAGSDVESHEASLQHGDILTSLPSVQRTPRPSFMMDREASSMDPRKCLSRGRPDDDATSTTSSSTLVTTPSRLSRGNLYVYLQWS
jgi:hypothetical protein